MALRSVWIRVSLTVTAALLPAAAAAEASTTLVKAGGNLQAAINAAQPGDTILLQAGATFKGNFTLPVKPGAEFITIRTDAPDESLPATGVRITPAFAPLLAKIQSTNSAAAVRTLAGAHHWRLQLLEFPNTLLGYGEIIRIGEGSSAQSQLTQVPYEIDIDRVYIHGHALHGQKRGIALNGRDVTIRDSYISDIKAVGVDTQAIGGWNGPGPFLIENNYLEAAGENFLLGGSDPAIPNLVTENVVVRRNYMSRPMAWRSPIIPTPQTLSAEALPGAGTLPAGTYAYRVIARRAVGGGTTGRSTASAEATALVAEAGAAVAVTWNSVPDATEYRVYARRPDGTQVYWTVTSPVFYDTGVAGTTGAAPTTAGDVWQVKNIFELKNARKVVVEYNVFENNWRQAQPGYAILFTPRNQDGKCAWCVVEDVDFRYNIVRHTGGGVNLLGYDYPNVSAQTANISIRHNLFYGITQRLGGSGWFMLIGDKPRDIVVDHNTIDFDGSAAVYAHGGSASAPKQITGFQFTNNALRHRSYGINGANSSWGTGVLTAYFPGAVIKGNWLQGGTPSRYPAGNFFTGTFDSAFADVAEADYRPSTSSILLGKATDGTTIGADIGAMTSAPAPPPDAVTVRPPSSPAQLRVVVK